MSGLIFKTKPRTVQDSYEIEAITDHLSYTFGHFLELRGGRPIDQRKFAKCPACFNEHKLSDRVYSAFGVKKNGKFLGNLFACQSCFDKYGLATPQSKDEVLR